MGRTYEADANDCKYHVNACVAIWLFQSPDGAAAIMSPPPYYVGGNHCHVLPPAAQYPDDLDDDDTDWDRLL